MKVFPILTSSSEAITVRCMYQIPLDFFSLHVICLFVCLLRKWKHALMTEQYFVRIILRGTYIVLSFLTAA